MLQRTFDAQPVEPLDPALIQLMLELSRAPDAVAPAAAVRDATSPPGRTRKPLSHFFAVRWPRRTVQAASPAAD